MLTRKYYQQFADILCEESASPRLIDAFARFFAHDNANFKAQRFAAAIEKCKRARGLAGRARGLAGRSRRYAVTGDFSRLVYSRHRTRAAAERARAKLARKWGWSHPGSEPRVVVEED